MTTTREGMRKALDDLRIGRDPGIVAADFHVEVLYEDTLPKSYGKEVDWACFGVLPGDKVRVERSQSGGNLIAVRVVLREEAPTFADLVR